MNVRARSRSFNSFRNAQEKEWLFSFKDQKLWLEKYMFLIQATQIDPLLKKSIQISFKSHVSFQLDKDLTPKPPFAEGWQSDDQDTFALEPESSLPCHR